MRLLIVLAMIIRLVRAEADETTSASNFGPIKYNTGFFSLFLRFGSFSFWCNKQKKIYYSQEYPKKLWYLIDCGGEESCKYAEILLIVSVSYAGTFIVISS